MRYRVLPSQRPLTSASRVDDNRLMLDANGEETVTHREWLSVFDRVTNEVKSMMAQQGRADEFVGCKVRGTTLWQHNES